ncbi:MAG: copper chaperone PCu(A)C [Hyphomicrobiaceae bacterium]|nr:MAG: copper chaperone PCu(A)C [Hyphomicrobiaceae bacterium]
MRLRAIAAAIIVMAAALPAVAAETTQNGVSVFDPWARATPRGTQVGSTYMLVRMAPGVQDRLVGAYSDVARTAALQAYEREGGVMRRIRIDGIGLQPGETTALVPGGYHILLSDLTQPLRDGQKFKLTLVFEKAGEMVVDVEVTAVAATGPRGGYTAPGFVSTPGGPGVVPLPIPGFVPKGSY